MTTITFWEKPGCGGNARQKAILEAAGHTLVVKSILDEPWTEQRLLEFFQDLPVPHWFNRSAVEVKNGEIVPEDFDSATALSMMVSYPLLIRRPLMQRGTGEASDDKHVGFVLEDVDAWIGLGDAWPAEVPRPNLEGCQSMGEKCPMPEATNEAST